MPCKMGGKCSGSSQNTSKVTRPSGDQVQAVWHVQSRADKQPQPALVLLVPQGRQNPCLWQGCRLNRNHLLPRCCLSKSILEKWGSDADKPPHAPGLLRAPAGLSLRKLFSLKLHGPCQATTPNIRLVLSFRLRHHLQFTSGLDKSGSPDTLRTSSLNMAV